MTISTFFFTKPWYNFCHGSPSAPMGIFVVSCIRSSARLSVPSAERRYWSYSSTISDIGHKLMRRCTVSRIFDWVLMNIKLRPRYQGFSFAYAHSTTLYYHAIHAQSSSWVYYKLGHIRRNSKHIWRTQNMMQTNPKISTVSSGKSRYATYLITCRSF